jgi:hypothetical protein
MESKRIGSFKLFLAGLIRIHLLILLDKDFSEFNYHGILGKESFRYLISRFLEGFLLIIIFLI